MMVSNKRNTKQETNTMTNKTIYLTVKIEYDDKYNVDDLLQNMDYDFVYEDAIQLTEILGYDRNEHANN
jgi:hypothetical protein|tara:strand:- start:423 stop:629 length:207 start_codon:yes stop_codon:yes gene_type:complete